MDFVRRNAKRVAFDGLGYLLLLISPAVGWIPGPGGIACALAGLGLLAVHNPWADRLKQYALKNGGKLNGFLFPKNATIEWGYDILAVVLLVAASYLIWVHADLWQITTGVSLFFMAVFIASMNRDRLGVQHRRHRKQLRERIERRLPERKNPS